MKIYFKLFLFFIIFLFFYFVKIETKIQLINLLKKSKNNFLSIDQFSIKHLNSSYSHSYLYGALNTTFEYFTTIFLGNNKNLFIVQVDTGSVTLAIPSIGCKEYLNNKEPTSESCFHTNSYYNPSKSKNSSVVPCSNNCSACSNDQKDCSFGLKYGDGSFIFGTLYEDIFTIGDLTTKVKFGAIEGESKSFERTDVDGIMGLAYHKLDPKGGDSIFEKLVESNQCNNSFSICLGYIGGVLILGGIDKKFNSGPMKYTPIIEENFYTVKMLDFRVNGTSIGITSDVYNVRPTIIDSGTTLLYLPSKAFNAMKIYMQNYCSKYLPIKLRSICYEDSNGVSIFTTGICFNINMEDILLFPTIEIILESIDPLPLNPSQYFLNVGNGFCFGISPGSDTIGSILGDVFMQGFNIHFDRQNKQIGFAKVSNCSVSSLLNISIVSGNLQSGTIGWNVNNPITIQIKHEGIPIEGILVEFTSDNAEFTNSKTVTNNEGIASTHLKLLKTGLIIIKAQIPEGPCVIFNLYGSVSNIIIILVCVTFFIFIVSIIIYIVIKKRKKIQKNINEETLKMLHEENENLNTL